MYQENKNKLLIVNGYFYSVLITLKTTLQGWIDIMYGLSINMSTLIHWLCANCFYSWPIFYCYHGLQYAGNWTGVWNALFCNSEKENKQTNKNTHTQQQQLTTWMLNFYSDTAIIHYGLISDHWISYDSIEQIKTSKQKQKNKKTNKQHPQSYTTQWWKNGNQ